MRHPSHERLTVLSRQYPFINVDKLHLCDTRNRAKQKKLPFTLSTSATTAIFDILYFDIWGPCPITFMQVFKYFLIVVDDYVKHGSFDEPNL